MSVSVPLCRASLGAEELELVAEVLRSGWLAHGPMNKRFEELFAAFLGVRHAVTMNSCTSALELAVKGLGLGGEVILPSFTFVASANALVTTGCTPVFVDVDHATRNVTAQAIEAAITPRTEAVLVVHYAGLSCDMDAIAEVAGRHGLAIIEDSAETIGGTCRGRVAGSLGVGCFSFFPTKNITTGEGGMLTTNDDALAARVRALCAHGISKDTLDRQAQARPWRRDASLAGHNYRLSNILAALGVAQMGKVGRLNASRRALAALYAAQLADAPLGLPVEPEGFEHVYQMYTVTVPGARRDEVLTARRGNGVEASVHFDPPVHLHAYYREHFPAAAPLPVTEDLAASIMTLPMFPDMTPEQVETVCARLREALAGAGVR